MVTLKLKIDEAVVSLTGNHWPQVGPRDLLPEEAKYARA